ncbi:hypothetical protein [Sphingomonas sp.]
MTEQRIEAEYCHSRARQERALAEQCTDISARRVHQELARRYAERAISGERTRRA